MTPADRRRIERRIAVAFAVTVAGAAGFGTAYVLGGQVQLEGASLGLACAGLSYGFAAWVRLLPPGPYVEEREAMTPPPAERRAAAAEIAQDDAPLERTVLPRRMLTLALGSLAVVAVFPLRSLLPRGPAPGAALTRTPWHEGTRLVTSDGAPVSPDDLDVGTVLTVFPEGDPEAGDVATLLIRVDPQDLVLPPDRQGWTVGGLIAYSKLCTHAGCPVGLYAQEIGKLLCPCHQSVFDVLHGAVPRSGPATRPLPQLPLAVDEAGFLVARGDFPEPVGAGFWRRA